MNKQLQTQLIKEKARLLGFSACGVARAQFLEEEAPRLEKWLKAGMHGKMSYLENWLEERLDPRKLLPGARSVISLTHSYFTDKQPSDPSAPKIARYAWGKDYHWVLKRKVGELLEFIRERIGDVNGRACVDSAPVLEKAWAARAAVGWIGKNALLLHPETGSYHFLCELIVDIELEYDNPMQDFCARCQMCLKSCPTGAIVEPQVLDARRCISYLTIEYRGALPPALGKYINNRVFGCDICQEVCPFNRKSVLHSEPLFEPLPELLGMSRDEWFQLSRSRYNQLFKGTAVTRARYQGLKRNLDFVREHTPQETVDRSLK